LNLFCEPHLSAQCADDRYKENGARRPVEVGPVKRFGSRGEGTSVYVRDPDGSLREFISYHPDQG